MELGSILFKNFNILCDNLEVSKLMYIKCSCNMKMLLSVSSLTSFSKFLFPSPSGEDRGSGGRAPWSGGWDCLEYTWVYEVQEREEEKRGWGLCRGC